MVVKLSYTVPLERYRESGTDPRHIVKAVAEEKFGRSYVLTMSEYLVDSLPNRFLLRYHSMSFVSL